jgi:hypothetical protein
VSHSFGYGLMDAAAMVRLARGWLTVAPQQFCEVRAPDTNRWPLLLPLWWLWPSVTVTQTSTDISSIPPFFEMNHSFWFFSFIFRLIPAKSQIKIQLTVRECAGVNFMEHLQARNDDTKYVVCVIAGFLPWLTQFPVSSLGSNKFGGR